MAHTEKKDPTAPASGSSFPGLKGALIKWWPVLLALAILAYLFARIPREALWGAFKNGPWLLLAAYVGLQGLLVLLADAYATSVVMDLMGHKLRYNQVFLVRGATYLLGILSYALGQGALGFYLQRFGLTAARAAGIMLFLMVVNLGVLLVMSGLGLLAGGLPGVGLLSPSALALYLAVGMISYLIMVSLRPRFLQGWRLTAPLLEAGLGGHLWAAAGRIPHVLVLILTFWGALRLWGIPVPLMQGLVLLPLVLFLSALPITPAGLGTFQGSMVLLISPFVPLANPEARAATVLAFSLVYYFFGIAIYTILGFWCYQKISRLDSLNSCLKETPSE